jgi:hypothetical protein
LFGVQDTVYDEKSKKNKEARALSVFLEALELSFLFQDYLIP